MASAEEKQTSTVKEDDDEDVALMFDLSMKKKRKIPKDKKNKKIGTAGAIGTDDAIGTGGVKDDDTVYTYEQLLSRVMTKIHENNPDLVEKKKYIMKPPQLARIGTKKTLWKNFQETCKTMNRDNEHVFRFFMSELGTEGSFDGEQRLVIRGKHLPRGIESLLRKYISEYITCQMCRSPNTVLSRDSTSRLHFVNCNDCSSSRSVTQIRTGFHAQTRADRRALRK